jgi:hypothetical protein
MNKIIMKTNIFEKISIWNRIFFEQRKCFMKVKMQVIQRNQKEQNELKRNF